MNLALAYLVLLAGTGADHRLTKWSTGAVSEHTDAEATPRAMPSGS